MKRVLVTGATGFIGRPALSALLEHGYAVHALGRSATGLPAGIEFHRADLMDRTGTAAVVSTVRPSHLLHLAWYAEHGTFWTSRENFRWVGATLDLLTAFHRAGGQRVVIAGSCAEYDWNDGRCDEVTTPLRPTTVYGVCKDATRRVFEAWCRHTGIHGAWGRVFHLYGPREHPDRFVASVARALLDGRDAECTPGLQVRDFLHVDDVAGAFAFLLNSDLGGAVNIGSGIEITLAEVARRIATLVGRPQRLKLGARPTPASDPPRLTPVTGRLFSELGWQPRYDLDRGLRQTIEWWRTSGTGPTRQIT